MSKTTFIALTCGFLLGYSTVSAQYSVGNLNLAENPGAWYDSLFAGKNPNLYEGAFYDIPTRTIAAHPFLGKGQWFEGQIIYRDQTYDNIAMIYDLVNEVLVLRNANFPLADEKQFLEVNPLQVERFQIEDFTFERYGETYAPAKGEGFYHVLYRGEGMDLIARRTKISRVGIGDIIFPLSIVYYLETSDGFRRIRGKRDLMLLFPDHKKTIKRFIRSRRLVIKEGNDKDFAQLVGYCDELLSSSL